MPRTTIVTAAARYEGGVPVAVDVGSRNGGVIEFHFAVGIGVRMLRTIDRIEEARRADAEDRVALVRALVEYLIDTIHADERERFVDLVDRDVIDVNALAAIFTAVREASADVDPTPPTSSPPAPPPIGQRSADGAPPEALTPAASPTTG